jgi:hypothetical protein
MGSLAVSSGRGALNVQREQNDAARESEHALHRQI